MRLSFRTIAVSSLAVPAWASEPPTADEADLLRRGEISTERHVAGSAAALVVGFGVGHAIQDRWDDLGWVFTFGEATTLMMFLVGVTAASGDDAGGGSPAPDPAILLLPGLVGFAGFRLWEFVDAVVGASNHNRRVREIRALGSASPAGSATFGGLPTLDGRGGFGGVFLRF